MARPALRPVLVLRLCGSVVLGQGPGEAGARRPAPSPSLTGSPPHTPAPLPTGPLSLSPLLSTGRPEQVGEHQHYTHDSLPRAQERRRRRRVVARRAAAAGAAGARRLCDRRRQQRRGGQQRVRSSSRRQPVQRFSSAWRASLVSSGSALTAARSTPLHPPSTPLVGRSSKDWQVPLAGAVTEKQLQMQRLELLEAYELERLTVRRSLNHTLLTALPCPAPLCCLPATCLSAAAGCLRAAAPALACPSNRPPRPQCSPMLLLASNHCRSWPPRRTKFTPSGWPRLVLLLASSSGRLSESQLGGCRGAAALAPATALSASAAPCSRLSPRPSQPPNPPFLSEPMQAQTAAKEARTAYHERRQAQLREEARAVVAERRGAALQQIAATAEKAGVFGWPEGVPDAGACCWRDHPVARLASLDWTGRCPCACLHAACRLGPPRLPPSPPLLLPLPPGPSRRLQPAGLQPRLRPPALLPLARLCARRLRRLVAPGAALF